MNLCIDVGNTRVKLAVFDANGYLVDCQVVPDLTIKVLSELLPKYSFKQAILSSVRSDHQTARTWLLEHLEQLIWLDQALPLPVQNDYKTPQTLGKDRIAAVVGATVLFPQENVLVVDAGTCITYDFITKNAVYKGGSILPGIDMRFQGMAHFTAKLPLVSSTELDSFIGNTTETAMQTGVLFGVLHELRGFRNLYCQEFGDIKVIVTGGNASYFESQLKNEIFAHPNLVLIGLNKILDYNRS